MDKRTWRAYLMGAGVRGARMAWEKLPWISLMVGLRASSEWWPKVRHFAASDKLRQRAKSRRRRGPDCFTKLRGAGIARGAKMSRLRHFANALASGYMVLVANVVYNLVSIPLALR